MSYSNILFYRFRYEPEEQLLLKINVVGSSEIGRGLNAHRESASFYNGLLHRQTSLPRDGLLKLSMLQFSMNLSQERREKGDGKNLLCESSPSAKRLVNLCKVSGAGIRGKVGGEARRGGTLFRDCSRSGTAPVDKTIAGGIIGIIYAGFSVGWARAAAGGQEGGPALA